MGWFLSTRGNFTRITWTPRTSGYEPLLRTRPRIGTSITAESLPHASHGTQTSAVERTSSIKVCILTTSETFDPLGPTSFTTRTAWVGSVVNGRSQSSVPKRLSLSTWTDGSQQRYLGGAEKRCEFAGWLRETSVSNTVNSGTSGVL